jgi:fructose-1-phosphate kinase PfkB-like protein
MSVEHAAADEVRLLCVAPNASIDRLIEVDRLVPGRVHRPDLVVDVPGGPGLTVARAAAALGADVVACAILAGAAGRWIAQRLATEVAAVVPVWSTGETRTAISIVSRDDGALTEILPTPEPVAIGTWEALEERVAAELAGRPVSVTISGSPPPGAPAYGIARLVRTARTAGVKVIVEARGEPLARALAEHPDVVVIHAVDAASLLGLSPGNGAGQPRDADLVALAAAVRERFDGIAVVTSPSDRTRVGRSTTCP